MDISKNIKDARTEKGLTQAEVAKLIGVERTNYHRLENRGSKLTIEQLEQIAQALGITLIKLLTWEEQEEEWIEEMSYNALVDRIKDLEESRKDKNLIIRALRSNARGVFQTLSMLIEVTGRELNLGKMITDGITEKERERDERDRKKGKTIIYPYVLTDEEVYQIIAHIHKQNYYFYYLLESLTESDLLSEDNEYAKVFRKYAQDLKNLLRGKNK